MIPYNDVVLMRVSEEEPQQPKPQARNWLNDTSTCSGMPWLKR
jgi:hypothetical protein